MWSKWSSKIKNEVVLEVSFDLKIYFTYTVFSYVWKESSILISVVFFCPKNPKFWIADTWLLWTLFLGTTGVHIGRCDCISIEKLGFPI